MGHGSLRVATYLGLDLEIDLEQQAKMDKLMSNAGTAFMPEEDKREARQDSHQVTKKIRYENNISQNEVFGGFASAYAIKQIDEIVRVVPEEFRRGRTIEHYGGGRKYDAEYFPHAQVNQLHVNVRDISKVSCRIMERYVRSVIKKYGSDYAPCVYLDDIRWFKYLENRELILMIWLSRILGLVPEECLSDLLFEMGKLYKENPYLRISGVQAFQEQNPKVESGTMRILSFEQDVLLPLCAGAGMDLKVVDEEYFPYYSINKPPYYRKLCKAFTIVRS